MPWSSSDRRSRLPSDWPQRRRHVLRRDGHRCQIRGQRCKRIATEVDHIVNNDDHGYDNLQAVCATCHREKTAVEAARGHAAVRNRSRRDAEPHPGDVEA